MITKICTFCKVELEASTTNFHKSSTGKYGLSAKCKSCYKKYCEENKEKISSRAKEYLRNNKDKVKDKQKEWRIQNKEYLLSKSKQYYYDNMNVRKSYNRKYSIVASDKRKFNVRVWRENNKGKALENSQKRRVLSQSVVDNLTEKQWEECLSHFNYKCAYCGEDGALEKEHFIPLEKKGPTSVDNILPSCRSCNLRKRSLSFDEWYHKHEFYSKERESAIIRYLKQART